MSECIFFILGSFFYSALWGLFKLLFYPFVLLGTWVTALSEALVWLVLSLFPHISLSWELIPESSSIDFLTVGAPFLGKSRFPFEVIASYSSFKALKGHFKSLRPWCLTSHNLVFSGSGMDSFLQMVGLKRLLITFLLLYVLCLTRGPLIHSSSIDLEAIWIPGASLWQDFLHFLFLFEIIMPCSQTTSWAAHIPFSVL